MLEYSCWVTRLYKPVSLVLNDTHDGYRVSITADCLMDAAVLFIQHMKTIGNDMYATDEVSVQDHDGEIHVFVIMDDDSTAIRVRIT